jgi:hypothetical protein
MSDLNRGERLQIMLTQEELKALDDWRFSRRMPSRAAAVRELLRLGLAAVGINLADAGRKSQSFGVMEGGGAEEAPSQPATPKLDGDSAD